MKREGLTWDQICDKELRNNCPNGLPNKWLMNKAKTNPLSEIDSGKDMQPIRLRECLLRAAGAAGLEKHGLLVHNNKFNWSPMSNK